MLLSCTVREQRHCRIRRSHPRERSLQRRLFSLYYSGAESSELSGCMKTIWWKISTHEDSLLSPNKANTRLLRTDLSMIRTLPIRKTLRPIGNLSASWSSLGRTSLGSLDSLESTPKWTILKKSFWALSGSAQMTPGIFQLLLASQESRVNRRPLAHGMDCHHTVVCVSYCMLAQNQA